MVLEVRTEDSFVEFLRFSVSATWRIELPYYRKGRTGPRRRWRWISTLSHISGSRCLLFRGSGHRRPYE